MGVKKDRVRSIEAVFFDYSGVMTSNLDLPQGELPCDRDALMVEMLGALSNQGEHPWHHLERGEISLDAFMAEIDERVPGAGGLFGVDSELNFMANMTIRNDRVELARELSEVGYKVGLVTNNVAEWEPLWRPRLPADVFAVIIDSAAVGHRKPEPGIYQAGLDAVGVTEPERAIFIDDFEWNVAGATALGMHGVHCTADLDLAAAIQALL